MSVPKINPDLCVGNTGKKLSDILTNSNNITNNTNKLHQVGWVIDSGWKYVDIKQGQSNIVQTLNIPKGIWLVFGNWTYEGTVLSTYTNIQGINYDSATSAYDDSGWVNMTVTGLANSDGTQIAQLNVWPRNKSVTINVHLWAIKIAN